MKKCKYKVRDHLIFLEEYYDFIQGYKGIDTFKRLIITNNLFRRINRLREYLSIEYKPTVKVSLNNMIKNNLKHMKDS